MFHCIRENAIQYEHSLLTCIYVPQQGGGLEVLACWGLKIYWRKLYSANPSHPKTGGRAWVGPTVASPWPGLQIPGVCSTRSTSSRKAFENKLEIKKLNFIITLMRSFGWSFTCSTPVLSLALVSTKIMLYLFVEHKNRHKRKMIKNFESYLSNEEKKTFLPILLPPAPPPSSAHRGRICCRPSTNWTFC